MIRNLRKLDLKQNIFLFVRNKTFLTNEYRCTDAWLSQTSSPVLDKVNLTDFYNVLSQNYLSKKVISAVDVDVFANAIKDSTYLEELKDLLQKLRSSAETGKTLESTHHATVRNYIEHGNIKELIDMLKHPLEYGIFLDDYCANMLLDNLLNSKNYEDAAIVAGLVMLQEDYTNEITTALCQYACCKYLTNYTPPEPEPPKDTKQKVEEVKIRVKFLRNPYYDDHFDIQNTYTLAGKTLAWMSEHNNDNLSKNLEIFGWLAYKKYNKLLSSCENLNKDSFKVQPEVLEFIKKESDISETEDKSVLEKCIAILSNLNTADVSLEESLAINIENAINKKQLRDISQQHKLFQSWSKLREDKLEEQRLRLERIKRMQTIEEKQKQMKLEEQKLWFFENEEKIDLEIEEKEKLIEKPKGKKATAKDDESYIPPEIVPKRK